MARTVKQLVDGLVGNIEIAIDEPAALPVGLALVAHPHPLYGGTLDNKVTQTLARVMTELGYTAVRPNFRGVGQTSGEHDSGNGETQDLLQIIDWMHHEFGMHLPIVLAGFSFGSFVQSRVASMLFERGEPVKRMIMVGTAAGKWQVERVPSDTIIIHGEKDDVITLDAVMRWAEPQELPVTVVAGAGHFFHGSLHILKRIVHQQW